MIKVGVLNKGIRPIVYGRDSRSRPLVIHPGKTVFFSGKEASKVVDRFNDAIVLSEKKKESSAKKRVEREK